jgi:hypothetical protein
MTCLSSPPATEEAFACYSPSDDSSMLTVHFPCSRYLSQPFQDWSSQDASDVHGICGGSLAC